MTVVPVGNDAASRVTIGTPRWRAPVSRSAGLRGRRAVRPVEGASIAISGVSEAFFYARAGHYPGEPRLWVRHKPDCAVAPGLWPAQQTHLPRGNGRDKDSIPWSRMKNCGHRRLGQRITVGEPDHHTGVQQDSGRPRTPHRCNSPSSAAKASPTTGSVTSTPGGTTTDHRKSPCNRSTSIASAGGGTRTATGIPRFVTTTRSNSQAWTRSRISKHFALNSLALTVLEPGVCIYPHRSSQLTGRIERARSASTSHGLNLPRAQDLLNRARRKAFAESRPLTSLIEDGLRILVNENRKAEIRKPAMPRVSKARGGLMPGVDLTNASMLQKVDDLDYICRMKR